MQLKEIPRKVIVAKRLSQCLNPALPTGVHQRALDVSRGHRRKIVVDYYLDGLMVMAFSWMACVVTCSCGHGASWGLFPFFEYSATSVKVCYRPSLQEPSRLSSLTSSRCSIFTPQIFYPCKTV